MLSQKVIAKAIKGKSKKEKFRKKIAKKLASSAGGNIGSASDSRISEGIIEVSKKVTNELFIY